jgi:glyoxylase-like metal-dependent hydrolase (beta-lactamase superfamily II)
MSGSVASVEIEQIAPHLWWWTAPHPDWDEPDFQNGEGWQREVSSYALVEGDDLVLFDPLVPAGEEERFWAALDGDVEQHGAPTILISVYWHARSSREILDRYEGATLLAHEPSAAEVAKRAPVSETFADGDVLPGGVEAIAMHHMKEAAFWLPGHEAIVFGDSLLGYDDGVRPCPKSWLRKGESVEALRQSVEHALEKQPRTLLLTHGGPRQSSEASL